MGISLISLSCVDDMCDSNLLNSLSCVVQHSFSMHYWIMLVDILGAVYSLGRYVKCLYSAI